jgi:RNA polymerase sigma factor (sigma-70 family)
MEKNKVLSNARKAKDKSLAIKVITEEQINKVLNNQRLFTAFIKQNEGFLHNLVKKFAQLHTDEYDDFYQIAMLSMHKALQKVEPKKSTLSTFAYTVIYRDLIQEINKINKKKNHEVSIENFKRKNENGNETEYFESNFEIDTNTINFEDTMIQKITVDNFFYDLEDIHKKIFKYRIEQRMKHKEVADKIGLNYHTYKHIWHYHLNPKIKQFQKNQIND